MREKRPSQLYTWATQKALSPKAPYWIGLLFILELLLFIPLDPVLMFFCLQNRSKIFLYVVIAAVGSLVSGIGGYLLGHFLWDLIGPYIVPHFISIASFSKIAIQLEKYENWAVFLGGLLPFPLKALSLGSGVFKLSIIPFAVSLGLARLLRFCLIGGTMILWGEKVKLFVEKNFHKIVVLVGAKVAAVFFLLWALAK